jgi:RNA polymerase sigma-70 factor (sigma-E family)
MRFRPDEEDPEIADSDLAPRTSDSAMEHLDLSDERTGPADPTVAELIGPDAAGGADLPMVPGPTTFDAFYADEYDRMVRVGTLICGSQATAEEVVQTAFIQVHQRWDELDNARAYLRASVVNGVRDGQRRHGRFEERKALLAVPDRATDAPDAAQIGDRMDLVTALHALPARQRAALVLRFYGGYREAEIAEALGVPGGTVKTLLRRGLARLRKEITP